MRLGSGAIDDRLAPEFPRLSRHVLTGVAAGLHDEHRKIVTAIFRNCR